MAHMLDFSNNRANIAYIGHRPWHGLGAEVTPGLPLDQWRRKAGLDFEYLTAPVLFEAKDQDFVIPYADRLVVYRSDTRDPLSVVSNRYHAVQPAEVLEFFRDLTEVHGFEMETAGSLKGGAIVWALAKTGRSFSLGNDESRQYTLLMTSCDSSLATRATLTAVRVVCWNTLSAAIGRMAANLVVTRHTTKFVGSSVKRNLGLVDDSWAAFQDRAQAMAKVKLKDTDVKAAILAIFGDPEKAVTEQPNQAAMQQVRRLFNGHGTGSRLEAAEGTAWGLLNAVTEYLDHKAIERTPGARLLSAWTGRGAALKQKAFDICVKLAA